VKKYRLFHKRVGTQAFTRANIIFSWKYLYYEYF